MCVCVVGVCQYVAYVFACITYMYIYTCTCNSIVLLYTSVHIFAVVAMYWLLCTGCYYGSHTARVIALTLDPLPP